VLLPCATVAAFWANTVPDSSISNAGVSVLQHLTLRHLVVRFLASIASQIFIGYKN
jgi:hypothetical protein